MRPAFQLGYLPVGRQRDRETTGRIGVNFGSAKLTEMMRHWLSKRSEVEEFKPKPPGPVPKKKESKRLKARH
jgi:hypothetical protein